MLDVEVAVEMTGNKVVSARTADVNKARRRDIFANYTVPTVLKANTMPFYKNSHKIISNRQKYIATICKRSVGIIGLIHIPLSGTTEDALTKLDVTSQNPSNTKMAPHWPRSAHRS